MIAKVTQFFSAVGTWWRTRSMVLKLGIVVIVAGILIAVFRQGATVSDTNIEVVKRQNLDQTVLASGTVVSSTDLSLSFEQSKVVQSLYVKVGDTVKKGAILAMLSGGNERAAVTSARGSLLAAQARYKKVLEGSSNEEIKLAQVQLDSAKKTQANLVANALRKLYSDDLIAEPKDSTSTSTVPIISGNYNDTLEGEYRISFRGISTNEIQFTGLEKGTLTVDELPRIFGTKGLRIAFPQGSYVPSDSWKVVIPNKSGQNYTANLNAYQAAVATSDATIAERQAELDIKRATARQPEIDAALADIVIAQAALDTANATLEKTILRAPADSTVTRVNIKIGEVPVLDKEAIALQDVSNLYLEANINETSVPLVTVGQQVSVTFDAFGTSKVFSATVSSVDPAATITDGIVNYTVKALLTDTSEIKPGMTANMTIKTASLNNVLTIPGRFITKKNGKTIVHVVSDDNKKSVEREVTTGLRGEGDMVEITSGLAEGERVLFVAP